MLKEDNSLSVFPFFKIKLGKEKNPSSVITKRGNVNSIRKEKLDLNALVYLKRKQRLTSDGKSVYFPLSRGFHSFQTVKGI